MEEGAAAGTNLGTFSLTGIDALEEYFADLLSEPPFEDGPRFANRLVADFRFSILDQRGLQNRELNTMTLLL